MREPDVVVVAAGPGPALGLPHVATVIAADGGADRAGALGLAVDVVIGDLDSISDERLAALENAGARVVRHPTAKDATDLELALDEALALGARSVLVVASAEGRLDHLLSSLLLLCSERYAALELSALVGTASVRVVRGTRKLHGVPGALVTLLPVGGAAVGISTTDLEYSLAGETLEPGSSRGVSNVFATGTATVTVDDGVVLAIQPAGEGTLW